MEHRLTPRMLVVARKLGLDSRLAGDEAVQGFRRFLARAITSHGGMTGAAKALELDLSTLSRWCQLLEIQRKTTRRVVAKSVAFLAEEARG